MTQEGGQRQPPQERRQGLIDATERALARHGAGGVSVRAIAAEADVSPGLVTHHFEGVEPLMVATYRGMSKRIAVALKQALEDAGGDPHDRLLAYVTAYFRPPVLMPNQMGAWLALVGLTQSMPAVEEAHREIYSQQLEVLEHLLASCGVRADKAAEAMAVYALIEGLWVELSLDHGRIDVETACETAKRWILDRLC